MLYYNDFGDKTCNVRPFPRTECISFQTNKTCINRYRKDAQWQIRHCFTTNLKIKKFLQKSCVSSDRLHCPYNNTLKLLILEWWYLNLKQIIELLHCYTIICDLKKKLFLLSSWKHVMKLQNQWNKNKNLFSWSILSAN